MQERKYEIAEDRMAMLLLQLLVEADDNFPARLENRKQVLSKAGSGNCQFSSLLDRVSIPFLLETLQLEEGIYRRIYPESDITFDERRQFAEKIITHCEKCVHCRLKRKFDTEEQETNDRIFETNKKAFGAVFVQAMGK